MRMNKSSFFKKQFKISKLICCYFINMKDLLLLVGSLAFITYLMWQQQEESHYHMWKLEQGFQYDPVQDKFRKMIFYQNLKIVQDHNSDSSQTYKLGLNQFAALSNEEFISLLKQVSRHSVELENQEINSGYTVNIDWSTKGVLTDIKNQGRCAPSWAFSSTGSLEALDKLTNGVLRSFSQQHLVDCTRPYGNNGCYGGLQAYCFNYVKDNGITTESSYPYTDNNGTCKSFTPVFKIGGFRTVSGCDNIESTLQGRPFSVVVDARNWALYKSGIFNNCAKNINHGILLVGSTDQYWKLKNSWGANWGQNGFIRLAKGDTCAVCQNGTYPTA